MITSRLYQSEGDLILMQEMLMQARLQTSDWRYVHIGELIFNYFMVECHLNPGEHIRLWHDAGRLVGYAMLGEDPSFDCQVFPGYEWQGIENEALEWAEGRIQALIQSEGEQWSSPLVSGARQDNAQRIAFLEGNGFRYRGDFTEHNLMRSLDEPIPDLQLPEGFRVRDMTELDNVTDRAAAQCEVWSPWTVGEVSAGDYARFMRLPGYQGELDIVTITPQGVVAAYVNGWIDPLNKIGDFGPVGARRAYRRQGLTRAALLEGLRRMKDLGVRRVCISTGVNNQPARQLYESIGFRIENTYLDYVK
jgi:mycothiol synthase